MGRLLIPVCFGSDILEGGKRMYQKVSPDMNFVDREKNVGKFWRNQQIFEKSMKAREGKPVYTFYDGPPTANGKPHIGHVLHI